MMIRYGIAILLASCVAIGLFAIMSHLILDHRKPMAELEVARMVNFVSVQPVEKIRERPREQPEPLPRLEPTPPPPMRLATAGQRPDLPEIEINMPSTTIDMGLSLGEMKNPGAVAATDDVIVSPTAGYEITRAAITKAGFPPQYPRKAARRRIEGYVVVEFTVNKKGSVEDVNVVESTPRSIFDKAATSAISRYTFQPAMLDGEPVASRARQRIDFQL